MRAGDSFSGDFGSYGGPETAEKWEMFGELVGGEVSVGGMGESVKGCLLYDLRYFGIHFDQSMFVFEVIVYFYSCPRHRKDETSQRG